MRFTTGASDVDRLLGALGVQTTIATTGVVFGPFAELTLDAGLGRPFSAATARATAGAKAALLDGALELLAGADARLSGAPSDRAGTPGILPWTVFTAATVRWGRTELPPPVVQAPQNEAPGGDIFYLEGSVIEQRSGDAVRDAAITVSGFEGTRLTVDNRGAFRSWPIPVTEGLVSLHVRAPGYEPSELTIPSGRPGETVKVAFSLVREDDKVPALVRGTTKDARSGRPVSAEIFVTTLGTRYRTDAAGQFELSVPRGKHELLISAAGYVTQKKVVTVRPGETIILNVDLVR
jgi:hypothetical protein